MHFVLLVLQIVLDRLLGSRERDVQLAARADGRLEQMPRGAWSDWLLRLDSILPGQRSTALAVRAKASSARSRQTAVIPTTVRLRQETGA